MKSTKLLEAIRLAKENEQLASDFYAEAVKNTNNPVGKELFEQLKEFEAFHYARLSLLE